MNDHDMDELAGITCARCDKVAPITAAELRRSDDRPEDRPEGEEILDDLDLQVIVPTPDGWYAQLEDPIDHGGEAIQHDVAEPEETGRLVCGDHATPEEVAAQALGEASIERTMRELAREEGVLPEEEEEGPRDPDDEDDDDPVPA
jgi:hypothetical protein